MSEPSALCTVLVQSNSVSGVPCGLPLPCPDHNEPGDPTPQEASERVRVLVAALRSGQYVQEDSSLGWLHADGSEHNCCLGVGCHVAKDNGLGLIVRLPDMYEEDTDYTRRAVYFDSYSDFMPPTVARWFGLDERNPYLSRLGATASVANDNGYTFDDIADAFEQIADEWEGKTPKPIDEKRRCLNCGTRLARPLHPATLCYACDTTPYTPRTDEVEE